MSLGKSWKFASLHVIALAFSSTNVAAQDGSSDSWRLGTEVYFWAASLGGDTTSGANIDLSIDEIIKDLKFGAMGAFVAQKGDWSIFTDLIYLDVGDKEKTSVSIGGVPTPISASIDLKGVINTTGIGYRVLERSGTSLDLTGGVRFLWLDAEIDINAGAASVSEDQSKANWDAVVGFRGRADLTEKFYLSYYADIGTGESDLTWQALAAINYRLGKVDLSLGYRYLDWNFDDFGPFDDLNLHGAFAGVKIPL